MDKLKLEIIADLGANYRSDEAVLETIIEDIASLSLTITNRKSIDDLSYEIKKCVKTIYLQRGSEDVKSLSESGRSSTYTDAIDTLNRDLVVKRLIP